MDLPLPGSAFELLLDQCISLPFSYSRYSDKISLGSTCRKVFDVVRPRTRDGKQRSMSPYYPKRHVPHLN